MNKKVDLERMDNRFFPSQVMSVVLIVISIGGFIMSIITAKHPAYDPTLTFVMVFMFIVGYAAFETLRRARKAAQKAKIEFADKIHVLASVHERLGSAKNLCGSRQPIANRVLSIGFLIKTGCLVEKVTLPQSMLSRFTEEELRDALCRCINELEKEAIGRQKDTETVAMSLPGWVLWFSRLAGV